MSRLSRHDRWALATATLLIVVAALIGFTFLDYGVTVDEEHGHANGRYFLNWYASGFTDNTINTEGNHYLYGSFFNAVSAFAAQHSPLGPYETGHLLIAVTGLIGIFFAWRIGKLLAGPMAGFLSAAILTLTPTYYGHMFMNHKDIPFAVLFLVTLFYLLRPYDRLPRLPFRSVAVLGVVIGLTLGIRIGALMLFGYCVVLVLLWMLARFRTSRSYRGREVSPDLRAVTVSLLKVGLVAWAIMLPWWPYAQLSPILNPLRAFRRAAHFTDFLPATVLFEGRFISANALPWHYLPKSFLIALPEVYAIALVGGITSFVITRLARRGGSAGIDADSQSKLLFLVFAILFPLVTAIIMRPVLYDATRHFLFVIPPLAVLAGVALASLLTSAGPRLLKATFALSVTLFAGATLIDMVRLHPYQYVFYNRSSGGLQAALGRYETDYWGQSHKEGIDWLISHYRPDAPPASIRVANTAAEFQTSYYLGRGGAAAARFASVDKGGMPHILLSVTRWNAHLTQPGRVLHVVGRMGTPLLYVVEVREPSRANHLADPDSASRPKVVSSHFMGQSRASMQAFNSRRRSSDVR